MPLQMAHPSMAPMFAALCTALGHPCLLRIDRLPAKDSDGIGVALCVCVARQAAVAAQAFLVFETEALDALRRPVGHAPVDAALANWWRVQGKAMCDRYQVVLRKDADEYHLELKAGRALKLADRETLMWWAIYANFRQQVEREDYAAAKAIIDGPTQDARMLSRAMNCFNPATPVPLATDSVARSFFTLVVAYQSLQEPELEGEWYRTFGAVGIIMPPELPVKIRSLLQAVELVATNFLEGLALALSTSSVKVSSRE